MSACVGVFVYVYVCVWLWLIQKELLKFEVGTTVDLEMIAAYSCWFYVKVVPKEREQMFVSV